MRRTSLPVKLQHDAGKFWGIIIFTRNCKILLFEHDVVQQVKKEVSQRSTSNLSEILMWWISWYWQFLQSYRFHKAAWPWASLKVQKGHTKINIELIRDLDVENTTIKLQLDTGNLWRVIAFTRSSQMLRARKLKKKRSHKGQDQTCLKFWWVEHHSLYSYNMMQANSDALSYSQGAARCCHLNMI